MVLARCWPAPMNHVHTVIANKKAMGCDHAVIILAVTLPVVVLTLSFTYTVGGVVISVVLARHSHLENEIGRKPIVKETLQENLVSEFQGYEAVYLKLPDPCSCPNLVSRLHSSQSGDFCLPACDQHIQSYPRKILHCLILKVSFGSSFYLPAQ